MGTAGGETFATSPTELRRYLGHSVVATCLIAGLPLVLVLVLGSRLGPLATVISMGLSIGLAQLGNVVWQRHPGSKDVVFNDLMLWGFVRRINSRKGLSKKVARLGIGAGKVTGRTLSLDEQTRLLKKLAIALESGDPYTHGHSQRVARHSYMIARAMKLPRSERERIRLAAIVHDVGKLRIPKDIINKPGALTDAQYDIIKTHSLVGAKMVSILGDPELTRMVRQHHERLDGTGYPDKLVDEEICLGARILAVADTFDATSSQRPYRAAQPHKVSIDILKSEAGRKLDAKVVDAFVAYYSGKRSFKWWAFAAVVPAHLRDLSILFAQRIGAAGIANAAVVGATAVALTPGPAARPVVRFDDARQNRPAIVAADAESSRTHHAPGDDVLGDKVGRKNAHRNTGKKNGHSQHVASLTKGRGRGRNEGASGHGNGNGHEGNDGNGNGSGPENGGPADPSGGVKEEKPPKEENTGKNDNGSLPPGHETPTGAGGGGSTDGGTSGGNGNGNGNTGGGKDKEEPAPTDPAPDPGDGGSGDSGSGGGSGSDTGGEPAPEEPSGPGNSGNAPGHDKGDTGGGNGNGGGGGKDKTGR